MLVVPRRGGTSEVVDLVHIQHERLRNVVPHEIKVGLRQQVRDVRLLAGEEIIDTDDVMSLLNQPLAQMRPKKTGPAGDENAMDAWHAEAFDRVSIRS
jgi:hypothetical protein